VAILDGEGAVVMSKDLGVTVTPPTEEDPWEEISAEEAEAGLMAELS
jgi:hypothetical protein